MEPTITIVGVSTRHGTILETTFSPHHFVSGVFNHAEITAQDYIHNTSKDIMETRYT
jgi:hypothetical protein